MKYLVILALILVSVGCSDDSENKSLKNDLREAKFRLETCENRLNSSNNDSSGSFNNPEPEQEEPEQPKEPQYETVQYAEVDGTKCYGRSSEDDNSISCGMSFWECKDGVVRRCMTNIKYKVKEEQVLITEEEN